MCTLFASLPSPGLRGLVAFLPMLERDSRAEVPASPDARLEVSWEPALATTFAPVLGVPRAWDVYMLYRAGVQWHGAPPVPDFWMHQLDAADPKRRLCPQDLTAAARRLLKSLSGRLSRRAGSELSKCEP
ncbi:MAG: hypothetical protein ACYCW6_05060 [Candidatus Xenobia bacterium]